MMTVHPNPSRLHSVVAIFSFSREMIDQGVGTGALDLKDEKEQKNVRL